MTEPDEPDESDEPDEPGEPDPSEVRTSWAAICGGGAGLCVGVSLGLAAAAGVHALAPGSVWVQVSWQVAGPLLAILGLLVGSLAFQRWFRGQVFLPAMLFSLCLAAGLALAFGPLGVPWSPPPAAPATEAGPR
ncbi:MAG TPA: hypothetical protein PK668_16780 [Myxococcota bacterium]|nr:hypothetical protein [Myxococcota bacterium]HRY94814.1 hypothetical protein [Myxococcota bacterium]HSA22300.1 hypothetical protein [Myxococcota bacterium]